MKTLLVVVSSWYIGILGYETSPPFLTDYRDAYCGTYVGKKFFRHVNSEGSALLLDSTNCNIIVSKNATDSILNIATPDGTYTAKLVGLSFKNQQIRFFGTFSGSYINAKYIPSLAPISYRYVAKK